MKVARGKELHMITHDNSEFSRYGYFRMADINCTLNLWQILNYDLND